LAAALDTRHLYTVFNGLTSFVVYLYLFVGGVNFFFPVDRIVSIACLMAAAFGAAWDKTRLGFNRVVVQETSVVFFPKIGAIGISIGLLLFVVWAVLVINRPSLDVDAHVYRLPLALLMNQSIWYPGIGKLNHHFGFPNGDSVLASVFTGFGINGFENIPNLLIWITFGLGVLLYAFQKGLTVFPAGLLVLLSLFTPDVFWQSYNMGSDLPHTCFLFFGLVALWDHKIDEAGAFFAIGAVMKNLAFIAFFLLVIYVVLKYGTSRFVTHGTKVIWGVSFVLIVLTAARSFAATGNPIYPLAAVNWASWGIPEAIQQVRLEILRGYTGIQRTVLGGFVFLKNLFFSPAKVNSGVWFSAAMMVYGIAACIIKLRGVMKRSTCFQYPKGLQVLSERKFAAIMILILLGCWAYGSPIFRFAAGIFLFITVQCFVSIFLHLKCHAPVTSIYRKGVLAVLYAPLLIYCAAFAYNSVRHVQKDVIPYYLNQRNVIDLLPYDSDVFEVVQTEDGFRYTRSTSNYSAGRGWPIPTVSEYSVGDEAGLVHAYRLYNRKITPGMSPDSPSQRK